MLKIHLLEALVSLVIMNFITIFCLIIGWYVAAAISSVLAAGFVWLNVNNEVLGKELHDFFWKIR